MEPPTKRPRFGPAPFDDDDSDGDELNSRPEEVNARRDPSMRLERSRAFAAFKLKSAFERIFDKYERDFTGVGDEINLKTGEVVVDNGHLQSLKDVQFGADDEDDDEDEGDGGDGGVASGVPGLSEEEKKTQGKPDNRLSSLGQPVLPLTPRQIDAFPFFGTGWLGKMPSWGGPPNLGSTMSPGDVRFGSSSMQYAVPNPMPTTDPTWSAPELPSPLLRDGAMPVGAPVAIKKKKARLSLTAATEPGGDIEDDLSLDVTVTTTKVGPSGETVAKKKVLLPRSSPETTSHRKKKQTAIIGHELTANATKKGKDKRATKSLAAEKAPKKTPSTTKRMNGPPQSTGSSSNSAPTAQGQDGDNPTKVTPLEPSGIPKPATPPSEASGEESAPEAASQKVEEVVINAPQAAKAASASTSPLDPRDPEIYINFSSDERKLIKKPRNQSLQVEIPAKKLSDTWPFKILTPEPSEPDPLSGHDPEKDHHSLTNIPAPPAPTVRDLRSEGRSMVPEKANQHHAAPLETFSRNTVDPAYDFSDEDEPALPRKAEPRPQPGTADLLIKDRSEVSDESWGNLAPGLAPKERGPTQENSSLDLTESSVPRAPSPTLSLKLDDTEKNTTNALAEPFSGDEERTGQASPPPPTPADPNNEKDWTSGRTRNTQKTRLKATGDFAVARGGPESIAIRPHETGRGTLTADQPPPGAASPNQALEIPDSDTPVFSDEHFQGSPGQQTARTSDHQQLKKSHSSLKHPPPPSTPKRQKPRAQTPRSQHPKSSDPAPPPPPPPPPSSTKQATTTTSKKKKKKSRSSILSLLPLNPNNYDGDDEDELAITIPSTPSRKQATATTTPHVRRRLLAPSSAGGSSNSSSKANITSRSSGGGAGGGDAGHGHGRGHAAASETVQTPGGTIRRCGEGGFRCGRDFCFVCC
ncbi:hypothetical protein VTK26DRAFT_8739 [Humicola hyalothermophila]